MQLEVERPAALPDGVKHRGQPGEVEGGRPRPQIHRVVVPEPQVSLNLEDFPVAVVPPQVVVQPAVLVGRGHAYAAKGQLIPRKVTQLQDPGGLGILRGARQVEVQAQPPGGGNRRQEGEQPRFDFNLIHKKRRRQGTGRVKRAGGLDRLFTGPEVKLVQHNDTVRLPDDPHRTRILPTPVAIVELQGVQGYFLPITQGHLTGNARIPVRAVGDSGGDLHQPVMVFPFDCCRTGGKGSAAHDRERAGHGGARIRDQVFRLERHRCLFAQKLPILPGIDTQFPLRTRGVKRPSQRAAQGAAGMDGLAGPAAKRSQVQEVELVVRFKFPVLGQGARCRELQWNAVNADLVEGNGRTPYRGAYNPLQLRSQIEVFRAEGKVQVRVSIRRRKPVSLQGQAGVQPAGTGGHETLNGDFPEADVGRISRVFQIDRPLNLDGRLSIAHVCREGQRRRGAGKARAAAHIPGKERRHIGAEFGGVQPGHLHIQLKPAVRQRHVSLGRNEAPGGYNLKMAQFQPLPGQAGARRQRRRKTESVRLGLKAGNCCLEAVCAPGSFPLQAGIGDSDQPGNPIGPLGGCQLGGHAGGSEDLFDHSFYAAAAQIHFGHQLQLCEGAAERGVSLQVTRQGRGRQDGSQRREIKAAQAQGHVQGCIEQPLRGGDVRQAQIQRRLNVELQHVAVVLPDREVTGQFPRLVAQRRLQAVERQFLNL